MLDRWSVAPLDDRESLFRWAVANAAVGNYDAHAKNVSVVYEVPERLRLAPAYDVVVTTVFASLDRTFSLSFGGTTHPQALTPASVRVAAREFRLPERRVRELAAVVVHAVRAALPGVLHEVAALHGDASMLEALDRAVRETSQALANRLGVGG